MARSTRMMMMGAAMAMMAAASMRGVNQAFPQNLAKVPLPPHIREMKGRARRRLARREVLKMQRRETNAINRHNNRLRWFLGRKNQNEEDRLVQDTINGMSNNQRKQWQAAGRVRDVLTVTYYAGASTAKGDRHDPSRAA